MGLTNVTKMLALSCPPLARPAKRPTPPPPDVVVLKHCLCMDCRNFSKVGDDYFCSEYIGGTSVAWATGKRSCDPPPDAWHYCSCYHGPQVSNDVWLWPRRSRQVGAGSTIAPKAEQPGRGRGVDMTGVKVGKMGKAIGTPPALGSEDGDGNGREHRFCFVPRRTQT